MVPLLDAHLHLWDTGVLRYPWLDGTVLDRSFTPADLPVRPEAAVVVQADALGEQALDEVRWISALATRWPFLRGVVAHAPLELGEGAGAHLDELGQHPLVVGVRRLLQDTDGLLGSAALTTGVRALAARGWPFDACVRSHQLAAVAQLARRCPDVVIVLDHLGKPAVGASRSAWREDLAAVAAEPNTVCKLSGLTTEAPPGTPLDACGAHLADALALFGPDRCLFGSDWPVASTTVGYAAWVDLVTTVVVAGARSARRDPGPDLQAVRHDTAARVYGLA